MADKGIGTDLAGELHSPSEKSANEGHQELADSALTSFKGGRIEECLTSLNLLSEQRQYDVTVIHNSAVADYYLNDFKNFNTFRTKLAVVCNLAEINFDQMDSLNDEQHCVICYNEAVLCYHAKQYNTAIRILNKLFTIMDMMDSQLSKLVALLSIEIYIITHQPEKALALVKYAQNLFYPSDYPAENSEGGELSEIRPQFPITADADDERFKLKLLEYKIRCNISLQDFTDIENELVILRTNCDKMIEKVGFESEKRYEERCKNMRHMPTLAAAYYHYVKGNYKQSMELVASIPVQSNFAETGDSMPLIIYNNMGCVHFYLKKPHLATFYFRKAIEEHNKNMKSFPTPSPDDPLSDRPLFTLGANKVTQLRYNMGVSLLFSGKPSEAFDCFTEEVIQVYRMNPRLWLRLAECCIMVHKPEGNDRDFDCMRKRKDILDCMVGEGKYRKLALNLRLFDNNKYSYDAQSFAIPVASLEFATLCLRNALMLLSNESSTNYAPSNPLIEHTRNLLRMSTLVASAYVALCIGDPLVALTHTRNLFKIQNCPGIYKLYGHLYAAEALIMLDRIPEAMDHLKPEFCNYVNDKTGNEPLLNHVKPCKPDSIASARAVLLFNLAVTYAIRGNVKRAGELLKQIWLIKAAPRCEIPVQIISLALYIELASGRIDVAKSIIKQNCPQYTSTKTK